MKVEKYQFDKKWVRDMAIEYINRHKNLSIIDFTSECLEKMRKEFER